MLWNSEHPNQYFAIDGAIYVIQTSERTLNALVCGGAYSVDKYYRLQHGWNWWSDEQPNELTKGLVRLMATRYPIDIMLTHTCPLRFEPKELFLNGIDQSTVDTSTEEFLMTFMSNSRRIISRCGILATFMEINTLTIM